MANMIKKAALINQLQKKIDGWEKRRKEQYIDKFPEFKKAIFEYTHSWNVQMEGIHNWDDWNKAQQINWPNMPYFDHHGYRESLLKYRKQMAVLEAIEGDMVSLEEIVVKKKFSLQDFFGEEFSY